MHEIREKLVEKSAALHDSIMRVEFLSAYNEAGMLIYIFTFDEFFSDILEQVTN